MGGAAGPTGLGGQARVCLSYSLGKPFSRNQHLYRSLICPLLICKASDEMDFVLPWIISQGSGLWARGSLPLGQVVEINEERAHRLRNRALAVGKDRAAPWPTAGPRDRRRACVWLPSQ